jgi:hypothetical protein
MDWAQFATMWKQLKEKIASLTIRISDDRKIAETTSEPSRPVIPADSSAETAFPRAKLRSSPDNF